MVEKKEAVSLLWELSVWEDQDQRSRPRHWITAKMRCTMCGKLYLTVPFLLSASFPAYWTSQGCACELIRLPWCEKSCKWEQKYDKKQCLSLLQFCKFSPLCCHRSNSDMMLPGSHSVIGKWQPAMCQGPGLRLPVKLQEAPWNLTRHSVFVFAKSGNHPRDRVVKDLDLFLVSAEVALCSREGGWWYNKIITNRGTCWEEVNRGWDEVTGGWAGGDLCLERKVFNEAVAFNQT